MQQAPCLYATPRTSTQGSLGLFPASGLAKTRARESGSRCQVKNRGRRGWEGSRQQGEGARSFPVPRPPSRPPSTSPSTAHLTSVASICTARARCSWHQPGPPEQLEAAPRLTWAPHAPGHASHIGRSGKDWAEPGWCWLVLAGAPPRGAALMDHSEVFSRPSAGNKSTTSTASAKSYHRPPLLLSLCLSSEADPSVYLLACVHMFPPPTPLLSPHLSSLLTSPLSSPLLSPHLSSALSMDAADKPTHGSIQPEMYFYRTLSWSSGRRQSDSNWGLPTVGGRKR
ncbi:hypothetical protein K456DRAFT_34691 [Colletotrichum gloeosporioides 23]|nr:hypothetical protein K456DRAFT_34691 [Colletotrichum gloeosporioides 23]